MINQPEITKDTHCETPGRPFLLGVDGGAKNVFITKPSCGLWSCAACGKEKARQWQEIIAAGANELIESGFSLQFVTLTHMGYLSPDEQLKRWRQCWPKLSCRFRRAAKSKGHYVYVHERHQRGGLHTHFITSAPMGTRWWKDNGAESGFGYMNDCRRIEGATSVAAYVSKYLTKSLELNWPKGWRRIQTSRNWPRSGVQSGQEVEDGRDWLVVRRAIELRQEYESLFLQGMTIDVDPDHFGEFYDVLKVAGLELSGKELAQLVP